MLMTKAEDFNDIHMPELHYASPFVLGWRAMSGRYKLSGSRGDADCIIAFSFGYQIDGDEVKPGPPNEALADYIEQLEMDVPIIAQFEVDDALGKKAQKRIETDWLGDPENYLDSHQVLLEAVRFMGRHKLKRPLLVAHRHHMPRLHALVLHHGFKPIVLPDLPDVWDPENEQTWIHGHPQWIAREEPAILFYRLKGYI